MTTTNETLFLQQVENREPITVKYSIDDWDRKDFKDITGMTIPTAFEQGQTGAEAFRKYFVWQKTEPHTQL